MNEQLYAAIEAIMQKKPHVCVAVDGRCAAGKSTLASLLAVKYDACIIHADDFFLPPELRTDIRYAEPGGNIDYERFKAEVLTGIKSGKAFSYFPFECGRMEYGNAIHIYPKPLIIIEGAYCMRPDFREIYDLTVFADVSRDEQLRRITIRNGVDACRDFQKRWIPLEEYYIETFDIMNQCDMVLEFMP